MIKPDFIFICVCVLLLNSCSLYEVNDIKDANTDFSQYKTFAWLKEDIKDSIRGTFEIDPASLDSTIRHTIQDRLAAKGLTMSVRETPDLWINYQLAATSTVSDQYRYSIDDINQSYKQKAIHYSSSFDANRRYTTAYEQSTLAVDLIDTKRLLVVWRGTVETPLGTGNPEKQRATVKKAVIKIIQRIPSSQ